MSAKHFACAYCGKRFADAQGRWQHTRARHPRKPNPALVPNAQPRPPRQSDDESIADLLIEAEINRAMGLPVDEWIEDMLS